jgi:hypothetical protein
MQAMPDRLGFPISAGIFQKPMLLTLLLATSLATLVILSISASRRKAASLAAMTEDEREGDWCGRQW